MKLVPGSTASREPPEPDLLCETTDRGVIAVEVVGPIDPNLARQIATQDSSGIWFEDPTEQKVRVKLRKKYETSHRMELLVCPAIPPLPGVVENRLISMFDASLKETRPGPLFQRLWLFASPRPEELLLVYPPLVEVGG
jgi:hypothetical protein